jgi:alpha-L-fucosidase 2
LDDLALAQTQLSKVVEKPYQQLKLDHINDYQQFYKRVELNFGSTTAPDLPTDKRLLRYAEGHEDKNLEVLYFQFGRYLLISSSRTPGVPANLQGIWNPHLRPPWSSNYTMNINVEENYWLAENANLSEMHQPLLSFISNLSNTGAITAKTFYGVNKGWVACHNSDIWAMTNPVGNFGQGDPSWANWNMGGAWISTHLWEHYLFTQDKEYLKNYAYKLMKGAAQFCLEWLVDDGNGNLVTSPSTSPENIYKTTDGYQGATLYGATADLAMIRACFRQTIEASKVLGEDETFRQQLEAAMERLYPYQISKNGHLQEWYHDWADADPYHRHQSHLFGLFPGYDINPEATPNLANASRKTLEIKGDETTGWSKGWRINLWARLWDGNRAYKMYRELLRYVEPDAIRMTNSGGGTYPNLFDAHPPFQIDGNIGGAAAVIEMLMQSTTDEIRLLPALPDAWSTGTVSGICARGGFEVSVEWKDGKPLKVRVSSKIGGQTSLIFGRTTKNVKLKKGASREFKWK